MLFGYYGACMKNVSDNFLRIYKRHEDEEVEETKVDPFHKSGEMESGINVTIKKNEDIEDTNTLNKTGTP